MSPFEHEILSLAVKDGGKISKKKKKLLNILLIIFILSVILMLIPSYTIGWKNAKAAADWKTTELSGCLLLPAKTKHYDSFEYCSQYFLPKYLKTYNDRQDFAPEIWNYFLDNKYNVFSDKKFNEQNTKDLIEFAKKWDDSKNTAILNGKIEKHSFATDADSTTVGDLINSTRRGEKGTQSKTYGYTFGGRTASANVNTVEKFPFATDANSTDVLDLLVSRRNGSGHATETHGYAAGGQGPGTSGNTDVIEKWNFAAQTNATNVGDLTVAKSPWNGWSY